MANEMSACKHNVRVNIYGNNNKNKTENKLCTRIQREPNGKTKIVKINVD